MTAPTTLLRTDEAVDLGHAWVQSTAARHGIRALLIKGPALHRHGLRDKRQSADIDVMVEPARFVEFCAAIVASGWRERESGLISQHTTLHSKTYIRDGWPCDLDVHSFYPGFLSDPVAVFNALWAKRVPMSFAHTDCMVPDRVAGALILALHSLRGSTTAVRHGAELEQLTAITLTEEERADAASLALATGSAATLDVVLARLGVDVAPPASELESRDLREWRERVASGSHGAYFWFVAFRRAAWPARPMIVFRAFWPTRHDLLVGRPATADTVRGRARARVARLGSGIRSTPAAVRAIVMHRSR